MDFKEILGIALSAIRANKLRSILTLLGVVVGVFSIIAVMTAVGALQNAIETEMSALGANTFQIQKFPIQMFSGPRDRWKYRNRKNITLEQAQKVADRMTLAENVGLEAFEWGRSLKSDYAETNPNVSIMGENPDGLITNAFNVRDGRPFTESEYQNGHKVVVIADVIAKKLFPKGNPLGQTVQFDGVRYMVIGVFEPKGGSLGGNQDNFVAIPLSAFLSKYGHNRSINIMVKVKSAELFNEAMDQARGILRAARKVDPGVDDDFAFFSNDSLITQFNEFTFYVKLGVGFISFIALIAAGVGIMNIMLVSVTERTREIGIRKAIGARKKSILGQFITEAMILSQIGGIAGILAGVLGGNLLAALMEVSPVFPTLWAAIGFALCSFVGIAFGAYPAWKAANLDPIEALRYE